MIVTFQARYNDYGLMQQWVCGVDSGSLTTLSYVAWLNERHIVFDLFVPTTQNPLPNAPSVVQNIAAYAIDAPQGFPSRGQPCRECDIRAKTPTRRLPSSLVELEHTVLYRSFVECGVKTFAAIATRPEWTIVGLGSDAQRPVVMETYPRAVALRLGFGPLPSKRR